MTWLLIDTNFLAWRSWHWNAKKNGDLTWKGIRTGVIYGILKEIQGFSSLFGTTRVAFCFDLDAPKRREFFEGYKKKRHTKYERGEITREEERARQEMRDQLTKLRLEHLPKIGYQNIFAESGYEADDMIASIVDNLEEGEEAIIISADHDLFQLIRPNVSMYNPNKRKLINWQSFKRDYGIRPKKWARVKAMAGCHSDEIPGIGGVAEKTALAYLCGTLPLESARGRLILSRKGRRRVRHNLKLVRLPYEGCPECRLKDDKLSNEGWREVCRSLGIKSLAGKITVSRKAEKSRPSGFGLKC